MLPSATSPDAVSQEINVVPMNFRKEYKPVADAPGEYIEVHAVDLVKKGSNGESTPWKINALRQNAMLWEYVEPMYERWLKGQEEPVNGTPLDVLPFVHPNLIDHLRHINIRTAEDLAGLTDNDMQRVGMGAQEMRMKAKSYVASKNNEMQLADSLKAALAERDAENDKLRADMDEMRIQLETLTAPKEPELVPEKKKPAAKGKKTE